MNNRLTIQDLAGLLAEYTGKDKQSSEQFLREFIDIISEGVFTDKLVKVKGLGTFKIILVEKRESIHVNTGERFLIPAHYKFSFLPDKDLREQVNKPFSFFETTELQEDVDFTDLDVDSGGLEDKEIETESVEEVIPEEKTIQNPVEEPIPVSQPELKPVLAQSEEFVVESVPVLEQEVQLDSSESNSTELPQEKKNETVYEPIQKKSVRPKRSYKKAMIILAIISSVLLLFNAYLYFKCDFITEGNIVEPCVEKELVSNVDSQKDSVISIVEVDTIVKVDSVESLQKEIIQEKENKPIEKRPEVIAEVKIEPGSRLTVIALKYYGHKLFWVYIYEYNKAIIADPNNIPIGTIIKVPAPEIYNINRKDRATLERAAIRQTEILEGLTK
jgi:nucleoid DNA-binding protein/nucleoid-associated protein YgaU